MYQFLFQYFRNLGLEISDDDLSPQMEFDDWPEMKKLFQKRFSTKTRDEWCKIFEGTDACIAPVLSIHEAPLHPHNVERETFMEGEDGNEPAPAPKLSRTPGCNKPRPQPRIGQHTVEVLLEAGFSKEDVAKWLKEGVIDSSEAKSSL